MKYLLLVVFVVASGAWATSIVPTPTYIYDGDIIWGSLTTLVNNPIYMYGGQVAWITGSAVDSEIHIFGGIVDGLSIFDGYLEITGGEITSPIKYYPEASMTLAGGLINSIEIETREWWNLNHIGIVCLSYSITDVTTVAMGDATGIKSFWLNVTFDGMEEQSIFVKYTDPVIDYYGPDFFLDITIIPEPATLALLGLGGLFVRRLRG